MDKWNIGALKLLNNGFLTQIVWDLEYPLSKKRKAFTAIIIADKLGFVTQFWIIGINLISIRESILGKVGTIDLIPYIAVK